MSIFHVSIQLEANPNWYDYIHRITLNPDGSANMVDGGGQRFNGKARGQFEIHDTGPGTAEICFTQMEEMNPYSKEKIGDLDDILVQVTRETGPFIFREQWPFGTSNPNRQICIVFRERFVFNTDPLDFARKQQKFNLYNITEPRDFTDSVRTYYPIGDEKRYRFGMLALIGFDTSIVV